MLLQQARIGPLAITYDSFTFQDANVAGAVLAEANTVQSLVGTLPGAETWVKTPSHLVFWAGEAGAVVGAEAMEVFAEIGPITAGDVERMRHAWFVYWKQYWKRRGRHDALPIDWACEVTLPMKGALD